MSALLVTMLLCGLCIKGNAQEDPGDACKVCPSGWTMFANRCYMFHEKEMAWADAERTCTALGANLASLRSVDIYKFIRQTIVAATGKHKTTWVGAYDATKNKVWLWSDGYHFTFRNWAKGEPNNLRGREHCMEINTRGQDFVNDSTCNSRNSFVCALDP